MQPRGLNAWMEMSQPFPGVWLPRIIRIGFDIAFAGGNVKGRYSSEYYDYRLAEVTQRIKSASISFVPSWLPIQLQIARHQLRAQLVLTLARPLERSKQAVLVDVEGIRRQIATVTEAFT